VNEDHPPKAGSRVNGRVAACRALLTAIFLVLIVFEPLPATADDDSRLFIGLGVLPQFPQFIGTARLPSELYRVEYMRSIATRWRAGPELTARSDFAILGAALHHDIWRSDGREWRLAVGIGYVVPMSQTDEYFFRVRGVSASLADRILLRLSVGQTFDLSRGRTGLRVESGVRLMRPESMLSTLEALDDAVDSEEGFWMYEIIAGLDLRGGRR